MRFYRKLFLLLTLLALFALACGPGWAQDAASIAASGPGAAVTADPSATATAVPDPAADPITGYFLNWFNRVDKIQAEQPHWVTPLDTVTPRLEEEYRFDALREVPKSGIAFENYGGGKGLELIPVEHIEVILTAPPAYFVHNTPAIENGFGDWGFLIKYRIISGNEQHGNYILTAFFQATFPTAQFNNGAGATVITPTIAYGKGFGRFDVQGTFGVTFPTSRETVLGHMDLWNNTFQYHLDKYLWPEMEVNYTHFEAGPNSGRTQVFLSPGLLIGRIHLWNRVGLTFGAGLQFAATTFHTYNDALVLSARLPFY